MAPALASLSPTWETFEFPALILSLSQPGMLRAFGSEPADRSFSFSFCTSNKKNSFFKYLDVKTFQKISKMGIFCKYITIISRLAIA